MEKLKFLETVTVNEFKAQKGVNKIEIKQNPHTGKCFFVYGCETGAVSDKFINGEVTNPVISQVCSPDTGDMFYTNDTLFRYDFFKNRYTYGREV